MINPYYVNFCFAWLCFSGGELTVRMIYTLTEDSELNPALPLAIVLRQLSPYTPKPVKTLLHTGVKTAMRAVTLAVP